MASLSKCSESLEPAKCLDVRYGELTAPFLGEVEGAAGRPAIINLTGKLLAGAGVVFPR